jgi:hypothetical protein
MCSAERAGCKALHRVTVPRDGADAPRTTLFVCLAVAFVLQRYLLEGGWGIRRNNAKTLSNVAQKVGLQMPKETAHVHHEPAGNKHHKARDSKLHFHDKFEK